MKCLIYVLTILCFINIANGAPINFFSRTNLVGRCKKSTGKSEECKSLMSRDEGGQCFQKCEKSGGPLNLCLLGCQSNPNFIYHIETLKCGDETKRYKECSHVMESSPSKRTCYLSCRSRNGTPDECLDGCKADDSFVFEPKTLSGCLKKCMTIKNLEEKSDCKEICRAEDSERKSNLNGNNVAGENKVLENKKALDRAAESTLQNQVMTDSQFKKCACTCLNDEKDSNLSDALNFCTSKCCQASQYRANRTDCRDRIGIFQSTRQCVPKKKKTKCEKDFGGGFICEDNEE